MILRTSIYVFHYLHITYEKYTTGNRGNKSPLIIKILPSVKANTREIWEKFLPQKFTPIQHVLKRYSYRYFCRYAIEPSTYLQLQSGVVVKLVCFCE